MDDAHPLDTIEGAVRRLADCGIDVQARGSGYWTKEHGDLTPEEVIGLGWQSAQLMPGPAY